MSNGWGDVNVSLKEHFEALREADQRALKIKEEADKMALSLASDIQKYKDEKANELRAQINSERGLYITRNEMYAALDKLGETLKPVLAYVAAQQGPRAMTATTMIAVAMFVLSLIAGVALFFKR